MGGRGKRNKSLCWAGRHQPTGGAGEESPEISSLADLKPENGLDRVISGNYGTVELHFNHSHDVWYLIILILT